jgi:cyclophilin family peptidyl-prolyl cis-trans isomerase
MANAGPNTAGSQFFVNTQDNSELLKPDFTVIGTVTEGREVIDRIATEVPVEGESPTEAVWIERVTVSET